MVVHTTTIGGSVKETGGGGGFSCIPSGAFAAFMSPVYSDYEDTLVSGSLQVNRVTSCWLGVARVHVNGNVKLSSTGALWPRQPDPNTVAGMRLGQCVLANPKTDSGPPGPGPF